MAVLWPVLDGLGRPTRALLPWKRPIWENLAAPGEPRWGSFCRLHDRGPRLVEGGIGPGLRLTAKTRSRKYMVT